METRRPVRLLLIRHGITAWNKDSRYQGQTDVPLGDDGLAQAEAVGTRLRDADIDRIYSSDLSRARQTAEAISRRSGVPVRLDSRLRELSFGQWEGLTFDEITSKWPEDQKRWLKDPVSLSAPGGETAAQLGVRLREALGDIYDDLACLDTEANRKPCGVIVSHGGAIRALMAYASTGSMTDMWARGVRQASVTTCEMTGDALALLSCDDVAHLEEDKSPDRLSESLPR